MTASPVQLDSRVFHKRLRVLCHHWRNAKKLGGDALSDVDTILIHVGIPNEATVYQKSTALHFWLFGYEFPETILAIHLNGMSAITSPKKGAIMDTLNSFHDKCMDITIHKRGKDAAEQDTFFAAVLDSIQNHGSRVGILGKDKADSALIADWNACLKGAAEKGGLEMVDVGPALAAVLAVKDEEEQGLLKTAAKCSHLVMEHYVVDQILTIIDEEKKVPHDQLSDKIERCIVPPENPKKKMAVKFPTDVNTDYLEMCYPPIIQSGGAYNLRPSAASDANHLHFGTILCSLGIRYKSYCANMARTFLIQPTAQQETDYKFLLELQRHVFAQFRPGLPVKAVYEAALAFVKEGRPDLEGRLPANLGFGMGLEFRESDLLVNAKNEREIRAGMIFNVAIGFSDLANPESKDERGKKYALMLADTLLVFKSDNLILTEGLKKLTDVSFEFQDDKEQAEAASRDRPASKRAKATSEGEEEDGQGRALEGPRVMKTRLRSQSHKHMIDTAAVKKRGQHQKELLRQTIREGLARASDGADGSGESGGGKSAADKLAAAAAVESYKKEAFLPGDQIKELKIFVDKRAESVLLPIFGQPVPFHITTIKNVSKSEEGEFLYLRINFNIPTKVAGSGVTGGLGGPAAEQYIKSLTFRSADTHHMLQVFKELTELRKSVTAKEAQKKEMADLVVQENLVELKAAVSTGGKRAHRLPDVYIRPALEGKRLPGDLEIHANGVRYRNILKGEQKVDILFSNVKHLFFQPCDKELIVLLHFHLKNPIMLGKKKTKDVQFYREASDTIVDETGGGRGRGPGGMKRRPMYGDEDEIMAEQEEKRHRAALNQEFKGFCERLAGTHAALNVDIPIRQLGFVGVPHRQSVLCQPTRDCLVHLSDPPFLVVSLADVEVASLERVLFHLKNFDLIFIMKDKTLPPQHIDAIPMTYLDPIKEWLDSSDVYYMTSNINFNWTNVLKTVREDPAGFYEMGGWSVIQANPDAPPSDASSEASDSGTDDSVYEEPDEDEEDVLSSSEEDSESEASAFESEDDSEEYSDASDGEEDDSDAMDWDELEEKTKKDEIRQRQLARGKK